MADSAPHPPRIDRPTSWAQEHALLLLGMLLGGALLALAWSPIFDREAEVEREFQLITRGVETAIQRDWEAEAWQPTTDPLIQLTADGLARSTQLASSVSWEVSGATRNQVFETYLAESERAETAEEWVSALSDLQRAAQGTDDPRRLTLLDLRTVQVGSKAKLLQPVSAALERLAQRLDGSERSGERPILGDALIAANTLEVDPAEHDAALLETWQDAKQAVETKLVAALQSNRLALDLPIDFQLLTDPIHANRVIAIRAAPLRRVYWELLSQAATEATRTAIHAQQQAELRAWLGQQFSWRPGPRIASLLSAKLNPEQFLYALPTKRDQFSLWILARDDIQSGLQQAWASRQLIPEGYRAAFRDPYSARDSELGRPLRGLPWNIRVLADEGTRARQLARDPYRVLRVALHLFGAICVLAGLAMQRQRNRERAVQRLKSDFVANVSHELRTPLSSILLMAENLTAGRASEKNRTRYHELILREAQRLRRLVDDVLDFSRIDRGEGPRLRIESTTLPRFAESLQQDLQLWAGQHDMDLAVQAEFDREDRIDLDPESIRRAILNLVDNARRHSGSRQVTVDMSQSDSQFCIAVRDHGKGLPADALETVFQPFQQLQSSSTQGKGAGLGLAIVSEIASAHGGEIHAESPVDGGACFVLTIPLEQSHGTNTHPTR